MSSGRRCFSLTRYPYGVPPRVRTNSSPPSFPPSDGGDNDTITVSSGEMAEDLSDLSDFSELNDSIFDEDNNSDVSIEVLFDAGRMDEIVSQIIDVVPVEHRLRVMDLLVELRSLHL